MLLQTVSTTVSLILYALLLTYPVSVIAVCGPLDGRVRRYFEVVSPSFISSAAKLRGGGTNYVSDHSATRD